jgi:hypothetical protein
MLRHPLLFVILFSSDVIMEHRDYRIECREKGLLIEALFQNGFYVFVGAGIQRKRTGAGGFESLG